MTIPSFKALAGAADQFRAICLTPPTLSVISSNGGSNGGMAPHSRAVAALVLAWSGACLKANVPLQRLLTFRGELAGATRRPYLVRE